MYATAYVWAKVLGRLEAQLSDITVSAWMDDTEVISLTEDKLVLYSPSDFRQEIIRERCAPYIQEALKNLFHLQAKVEVWGDRELRAYRQQSRPTGSVFFNPQFSFDNYVSGQSNQIAVKIARAAAEDPGQVVYNPLFLYGPPGVGKTHLQYAIANRVLQKFPDKKVVCVRGDQFTNELISAIRAGETAEFKEKYRQADILLVDDIQFIAGKEATQEEFFHTFNALYEQGKQIVMTADRKPTEMTTLEDRLQSRFGAGILVAIEAPDYATRLSIIRAKAAGLSLELSEEVISYLAEHLTDNVRQIEGALKKIRAFRDLDNMALTLPNIARTVADVRGAESRLPITPALILRNVCRYYGISQETLKGPQKSKGVAEPRQIAMYLMRKLLNLSFPDIGKEMGRDHGTVHHAVKKIQVSLTMDDGRLEGIVQDILANMESTPG